MYSVPSTENTKPKESLHKYIVEFLFKDFVYSIYRERTDYNSYVVSSIQVIMDFQSIAKECVKDGLCFPNPDKIFIANVSKAQLKESLDTGRRARIDSVVKTTRVAEGMDPSTIPIKCYAPCHVLFNTDSVFSDFKDELSVKEYNLSGFCQRCQDFIFEEVLGDK